MTADYDSVQMALDMSESLAWCDINMSQNRKEIKALSLT